MKFKKYSSIENSYRTKTINHIVETGNTKDEWVLLLKVHGANYSLWYDGEYVKRGKRSGFIRDSFYGDFNFDYSHNIKCMYESLKDEFPYIETLTICGEIYGGLYNHTDVNRDKSATCVQRGVSYRPDNDFIVYDIKIDNMIIDHDKVTHLCKEFGFMHVPILERGNFYELMKYPVIFQDPIGDILGYPAIEKNFAEGWVLKPIEPKFFGNGSRIILKGKNPEFSENNGGKIGKLPKPVYELSELGDNLRNALMDYLTENRLKNVLSHGDIENIDQKAFGKLLGLFSKDAYDDFIKDYGETFNSLEKKEQFMIKKNMNRVGGDVIRPNFVNIMDGEF